MMEAIGLDIECTKLPYSFPWQKEAYLVMVGIVNTHGQRQTWTFNHDDIHDCVPQQDMIQEIQHVIIHSDLMVGHNLKFDLNWLTYLGIDFSNCKLFCTQAAEYLLRGQRGLGMLSLDKLSKQYLQTNKIDKVKTFWEAGYETSEIPLSILKPYLEQDCINTLAIWQRQLPKLQAEGIEKVAAVQMEAMRVLSEIECNGARFSVEIAQKHAEKLRKEFTQVTDQLMLAFNPDLEVNLASNKDLSALLFGGTVTRDGTETVQRTLKSGEVKEYQRKCVVEHKIKGAGFIAAKQHQTKTQGVYKTDKNTIKVLPCKTKKQKQIKELLLQHSSLKKALETLVGKEDNDKGLINKVMLDGCVHSHYNMTVTKTGRLSSSDPNGQNIPREGTSPIKLAMVPRNDYIMEADLSQIEWRGAAELSQDPVMIREILEGVDPHTDNAVALFNANPNKPDEFKKLRTTAKICTFRLLYGGSAYSFFMDQKMPNYPLKKWEAIVNRFYKKYKGLKKWQNENISTVLKNKGVLRGITGRKFIFDRDQRKGGYRVQQIKNYPVQSFATADLMPLAMVIIYKRFKARDFQSKIIMQIHDALIFDVVKEELDELARLCVQAFEDLPKYVKHMWGRSMSVPITGDIDVGTCWGNVKEYKL